MYGQVENNLLKMELNMKAFHQLNLNIGYMNHFRLKNLYYVQH